MNAPVFPCRDLAAKVQQYLDERRRLGFKLRTAERVLKNFERFVAGADHTGPLTVELIMQWAPQVLSLIHI